MHVPLLDLKTQFSQIRNEIFLAMNEIIESQEFILGPKVGALEHEVASYSETKYGIGVSSGTDALLVALMALDVAPGDEVITTPFTFFATAGVIARLCAKPVFVDIDPVTFNMRPALLENAITRKTKAIIPVHIFGQCVEMEPILAIAGKRGIPIIEDAAQSIGAEYQGHKSGSMGAMGVFSFFPSKNLGGFGDGGMVVTNDARLDEKIRALRQHGATKAYHHKFIGGNFRLDAVQAAALSIKLKHLDAWSAGRRENAKYYTRRFEESNLVRKELAIPPIPIYEKSGDTNYHIFNQFTLRVKDREKLKHYLKENDIGTAVYYPVPLHLQECFKYLGYKRNDFPESEIAAKEVLSIPIYPELTPEQKAYVVNKIALFYQENNQS